MTERLNPYGYITCYLVSGLKERPFVSSVKDDDQMRCEKRMRQEMADEEDAVPGREMDAMPGKEIRIGGESDLGMPWEYWYSYGNWFVDMSKFYPGLAEVELHGVTVLVQKGQKSGMIDVSMGQKYKINVRRSCRNLPVLVIIRALFHTIIYQYHFAAGLQHMAASSHLVGRSQKCKLHSPSPFHFSRTHLLSIIITFSHWKYNEKVSEKWVPKKHTKEPGTDRFSS